MAHRMRHIVLGLMIGCTAIAEPDFAQEGDFYYYRNQRIRLTPSGSAVALVGSKTNIKKYGSVLKYFSSIVSDALGKRTHILLAKPPVGKDRAEKLLATAEASKEVYPLSAYSLDGLTLVPQNQIIVGFKQEASEEKRVALLRKFSSSFQEVYTGSGEYLVTLGNPAASLSVSKTLHRNHLVSFSVPNFLIILPLQKTRMSASSLASGHEALDSTSTTYPNDFYFSKQWYLESRTQNPDFGKNGADIHIRGAWAVTKGSNEIRVAILDDGVDVSHPDLTDNILRENGKVVGWNFIGSSSGQVQGSSCDTHGTQIAGIVAANTNNAIGVAGVAPNIKIIPIRMASCEDSLETGHWTSTLIVDNALRKAVELGADVINGSFWLPPTDNIDGAIDYALKHGRPTSVSGGDSGTMQARGAVLVFASGDHAAMTYPATRAATSALISVGATNMWDEVKANGSKDGVGKWESGFGQGLSLVAPGVSIWTTTVSHGGSGPNDDYEYFDGTSAAAPQVAGVAALLLSIHPDLTAAQVKDKLMATADKLLNNARAGSGRLNACRALDGTQC